MVKTKKNRQYEIMTKDFVGPYVVRVWTHSDKFMMGSDPKVVAAIDALKDWREREGANRSIRITPNMIAKRLDRLGTHVTAYEILDALGHGGIVYPDWR